MNLGIDIGGTYLRYELREDDKTVTKKRLRSSDIGLCEFLENILNQEKNITHVFISYAGQVNNGVILDAPNINIDRHNLQTYIEGKYGVKLFIENDVNCAVLAEAKAYDVKDICAVYVGTGLGLGVISASALLRGHNNIAAELGHIPYKKTPFTCNCGKNNCIELFASGSGLLKWKKEYTLNECLTLQQLYENKNSDAKKLYSEFLEALLYAIGTTITIFNPEIVVLGGGIIKHNKNLLNTINAHIKAYAMPLSLENTTIRMSQLEDATLEGAFLLKDTNV